MASIQKRDVAPTIAPPIKVKIKPIPPTPDKYQGH